MKLSSFSRKSVGLHPEFAIEYGTDEIHSQQMPFSPIAIPFPQDFERFDPGIDVFNHNTLSRQLAIKPFLLRRQRMILALFVRDATVLVQRQ